MLDGIRALARRSSDPGAGRAAHTAHHATVILLVAVLAVITSLLFPNAPIPDLPVLEKGMVAREDIIARIGFPVYKSEDELARDRAEAAASVVPVFEYAPQAVDTMLARVRHFLSQVDAAAAGGGRLARDRIRQLALTERLQISDELLAHLESLATRSLLRRSLETVIREELPLGIAATADLPSGATPDVRLRRGAEERLIPRDSVLTGRRLFERAARRLPWATPSGVAELQRLLLIRFFDPSIKLDRDATSAARTRAGQAISPVKERLVAGERIVGAHEQVREEDLLRLQAYQDQLASIMERSQGTPGLLRSAGSLLLNFLVLLILGGFVFLARPAVYNNLRQVVVLAALVFSVVVFAAAVERTSLPLEAIPVALPAILIAALWDRPLALASALVGSLLVAGQAAFAGPSALAILAIPGAAAALSVGTVRRRAQAWVYVALIAAAYTATAIALGLLRSRAPAEILHAASWGSGSALISVLVAMGLLPLLEAFTRITTDQTLLELADLNRPLLRRLALEAPGTYAHSISVANLAGDAAQAIGANPLLARVGAYYHDVGKILAPHYFVENQRTDHNPHDHLQPDASAAILRAHVAEGERLAREYRVPHAVARFIREHHGTQTMPYFLDQARTQENPDVVDVRDFVYTGPKPQSRETALLMLADSVEAASRVLDDATPERIRALVDRIVDAKIADGQLDETPLTMHDISLIRERFSSVLAGVHHHRLEYPKAAR